MQFFTLAALVSAALSGASAIVIPGRHIHHVRHDKPDTYYEPYLEPYQTYHTRYLAIGCDEKHDTQYFADCCHPMLSTETLQGNRKAYCNPANLVSSTAVQTKTSSAAAPTGTQVLSLGDGDDDCDDDDATDDEDDCDDDDSADNQDDDDCEDDEPTSSAAPSSTKASTSSTHAPATSTKASSTAAPTSAQPTSTQAPTSAAPTSSKEPVTTSQKPSSTSTSQQSAPTSGGETFSGDATFFFQNGQAGACGTVHQDTDFVIALQTALYGALDRKSANCGRKIKLTNQKNGKSVEAVVADACPTCAKPDDLDLSHAAFIAIATEAEGEVPIKWSFIS